MMAEEEAASVVDPEALADAEAERNGDADRADEKPAAPVADAASPTGGSNDPRT
jgi:hypothetical protein